MAKKQTSAPQNVSHQTFVITVGYILFSLMVIGVIVGTILPFSHIFSDPRARHLNVAVFMASLVLAALLPSVIGYFVGESGTRGKSRQLHHYNGMLFAALAYWIYSTSGAFDFGLYSYIGSHLPSPWSTAVGFMVPVVIVAIVVGVLAGFYHHGRGKQVVVAEYKPFQVVLFALVIAYVLSPLQYIHNGQSLLGIGMNSIIMVGVIGVSYACLLSLRITVWRRLVLAIVGTAIVFITLYTTSQFSKEAYSVAGDLWVVPTIAISLISLLVWMLYLYITRLSYRK